MHFKGIPAFQNIRARIDHVGINQMTKTLRHFPDEQHFRPRFEISLRFHTTSS